MKRLRHFLAALALGSSASAFAALAPDAVVTTMTEQVLSQAGARRGPIDATELRSLIETAVMPNVDFRAMTSRAVGPRWRGASEEQRTRLMAAFESLLIKTYAGALSEAGGARFRLRSTIAIDPTTAEVKSDVTVKGGREPIALNYRLALQDDRWKIVDVGVMGVWLVASYQTQFAQVMERSGGIDGLVQVLEERSKTR
ncbi:MAG TPA: ABC transporter substrate-binding protein [Albitalea sp.]